MTNNLFVSNTSEIMVEVYYEPIVGEFNLYPFYSNNSTMNDIDTGEVLEEYLRRFEDAWKELADK